MTACRLPGNTPDWSKQVSNVPRGTGWLTSVGKWGRQKITALAPAFKAGVLGAMKVTVNPTTEWLPKIDLSIPFWELDRMITQFPRTS